MMCATRRMPFVSVVFRLGEWDENQLPLPPRKRDGMMGEAAQPAPAGAGSLVWRRRHAFRFFLAAALSGDFAYQMQSVAVAWQVFQIRHSTIDLGLVGLAAFLPTFVLALVAGYLADRHDRKTIALLAALGDVLSSIAFLSLVMLQMSSVTLYLLIILCQGTVRAIGSPAERTLLVAIVPPDRYLAASARFSSLGQLVVIGGPAAGGALIVFGTAASFAAAAAMSMISALALALLFVQRHVHEGHAPTLRDALGGLRFILASGTIAGAISLDLVAVLFGGATALLPVYADTILHWGPLGLGALRSAPALGAAVTGFVLSRHPPRRRIGRTLLITVAGFGFSTIVFGLSQSPWLSLIALAFVGGTDMVSMVIRDGLVQLNTPDAMRGRVNAAEGVFIGASNQLGAFESGMLAAAIGTVPAVVAGGVATIVVILLWTRVFPGLRRADRYVTP